MLKHFKKINLDYNIEVSVHKVDTFLISPARPLSPLKGKPPAASALAGSPLQGS